MDNILIKRKEDNIKIKLKSVYKIARITGRCWCATLDKSALIYQKTRKKRNTTSSKRKTSRLEQHISRRGSRKYPNKENHRKRGNFTPYSQLRKLRNEPGASALSEPNKRDQGSYEQQLRPTPQTMTNI